MQSELIGIERLLHATQRNEPSFGATVVLGVEEKVAVAAGLLGAVHRVVGVTQQGFGIRTVERENGRPDARRDHHRPLDEAERVGLRHLAQDALDGMPAFLERGGSKQQHELVAADARDHVVATGPRTQAAAHAAGQIEQQAVAGFVTEAVVDRLEVIEVEVTHGQQRAFTAAGLHRRLQHLCELDPIRQTGEFVEMRLSLQLLELGTSVGHVGDGQHVVAHAVVRVAHGRHAQLQQAGFTVTTLVAQLAAPGAGK